MAIILFLIFHDANDFNQFFQFSRYFFAVSQNCWGNMLGKKRYIFNRTSWNILIYECLQNYIFIPFCFVMSFWNLKCSPGDTPPSRGPYFLVLPKKFHQLGNQALKYITLCWVMGYFLSQTTIERMQTTSTLLKPKKYLVKISYFKYEVEMVSRRNWRNSVAASDLQK